MYFTFLALCSQLALVDLLLSKCCGNLTSGCWQMIHHPPETDPEQLLSTVKDSHLIYPVLVDKQDMASENHHLIGLVPPGSIAFVVPKGERDNYPKKLMMAVFEAWPVLILTILLSILAGVFLWLLVSVYLFFPFSPLWFRGRQRFWDQLTEWIKWKKCFALTTRKIVFIQLSFECPELRVLYDYWGPIFGKKIVMISWLLWVYPDRYWPADLTCLPSVSFLFALLWEL